ncbi:polysaccharide deacetylase family protein [Bacillus sp. USDA818B3_A]|uniref:polysaccharide deacetylase family protein n=1 Tax=Bacillus sp. USDA818B3_A TaxID=2698834 RepID=UPI00136EFED2|nr:polysaccharide deacetylase family protein [Bacillus sp. USDA818B3_A]
MIRLLILWIGFAVLPLPNMVSAEERVPMLIYHSIADYSGTGSKELYVTPENFENQMIYLREHGFTLLTFEQWQEVSKVKKPIFITFDDGYKNNLTVFSIFQKLQTRSFKPKGTIFVISDFIGRKNRLSSEEIKQMSDSGLISIQSHTATHPDLTKSADLSYELKNSQDKIKRITGRQVIALAYPYGNTNREVIAETKKYYLFGLTTTPGPFVSTGIRDEQYLLPRTYVKYSTSIDEFAKIVEVN